MAAGKPCRCCPGGSALPERLGTVELRNNLTTIIFLSKHDWVSYQALEQEQRAARGAKPGRGVWHVLAEMPEEQDPAKCGTGTPDQFGNSRQAPPFGVLHHAARQAGQPAKPSGGRGIASPRSGSCGSHVAEF